jgi:L-asparaginase
MYKTIKIKTKSSGNSRVLVIYTGGTLGMAYDHHSDSLVPFDFAQIPDNLPEMARLDFDITVLTFENLLDSSNIKPALWIRLAEIIGENTMSMIRLSLFMVRILWPTRLQL